MRHRFFFLRLAALLLCSLIVAPALAQPPALMHYQGRLTNNSGGPITSAQTVYFSIWRGGSATTANSGTQLFRERQAISPDANGVFEALIGSGTAELNTLKPTDFFTSQTLHLQVAVGTAGNVLLPRALLTSVGYAFIADNAVGNITPRSVSIRGYGQVIDSSGNWTGKPIGGGGGGIPGSPIITSVADATGGLLVVGDLVQLGGSNLGNAEVLIGGLPAPLKARSSSQIVCQVPAGTPMGLNPVTVVLNKSGVVASLTVATVNVHRLLVWVGPGPQPQVVIFDALDQVKLAELSPGVNLGTDNNIPTLQMAFANEGSLALIPSNASGGLLVGIDLTRNPLSSGVFTISTGLSRITAVAVSPDNQTAVLSDYNQNRVVAAGLQQHFPPYSASGLLTNYVILQPPVGNGFQQPRGSLFVSDALFILASAGNGFLWALRRDPGTEFFFFYRRVDPNHTNVINQLAAGVQPFALRLAPDRTRLLALNRGASNLLNILVAPEGFSARAAAAQAVGANAWQVDIAADNQTVLVADSAEDLLHVVNCVGPALTLAGDLEGPADLVTDQQIVAIEPVEGRLVAVGTDNSSLIFYERTGGTLFPFAVLAVTPNLNRVTYELEFQP